MEGGRARKKDSAPPVPGREKRSGGREPATRSLQEVSFPRVKGKTSYSPPTHTHLSLSPSSLPHSLSLSLSLSLSSLTRFASAHEKTTNPGEREERGGERGKGKAGRASAPLQLLLQSRRRPARDPLRVPRRRAAAEVSAALPTDPPPGLRSCPPDLARGFGPGFPPPP
ncbi:hypothetical protein SEVIR_3G187650v4 [Setaria viridis]